MQIHCQNASENHCPAIKSILQRTLLKIINIINKPTTPLALPNAEILYKENMSHMPYVFSTISFYFKCTYKLSWKKILNNMLI